MKYTVIGIYLDTNEAFTHTGEGNTPAGAIVSALADLDAVPEKCRVVSVLEGVHNECWSDQDERDRHGGDDPWNR